MWKATPWLTFVESMLAWRLWLLPSFAMSSRLADAKLRADRCTVSGGPLHVHNFVASRAAGRPATPKAPSRRTRTDRARNMELHAAMSIPSQFDKRQGSAMVPSCDPQIVAAIVWPSTSPSNSRSRSRSPVPAQAVGPYPINKAPRT